MHPKLLFSALQIIAFFFEYLTHEVHPSLSSKVALMPGATTFLLLNSGMSSLHQALRGKGRSPLGEKEKETVANTTHSVRIP
jgi:hypothetical protein